MPKKKSIIEKAEEILSSKSAVTCPYCNNPANQFDSIKVGEDRWHYPCADLALAEWKKQQSFIKAAVEYFYLLQSLFSSQEEISRMKLRAYEEMEKMGGD